MCFFCGLCFCGCFFLSLLRIIFSDRIVSKYKKCCGTYVPQHFCICISLFYFNYPAFGSFDSAHLNSGEGIVELLDGRTHLVHTRREANFLAVVIYLAHGRYNGSGSAKTHLCKIGKLAEVNFSFLNIEAEVIFCNCYKRTLVIDGRIDGLFGTTTVPFLSTKRQLAPPVSSTFVLVAGST